MENAKRSYNFDLMETWKVDCPIFKNISFFVVQLAFINLIVHLEMFIATPGFVFLALR